MFKSWLVIVGIGAWLVGCAQFQDTVGCYTHADWRLGYDHNFRDSSFSGSYIDEYHGNPKNHTASSFSGKEGDEDRIATDVTLRFSPGACK